VTIGLWRHRRTDIIAIRCTHRRGQNATRRSGRKRPVLRCQPNGIVIVAGCGGCGGRTGVPVSRPRCNSVSTRKGSADEPASCIRSSSEIWFPASAPRAATSRRRGETGGQHRQGQRSSDGARHPTARAITHGIHRVPDQRIRAVWTSSPPSFGNGSGVRLRLRLAMAGHHQPARWPPQERFFRNAHSAAFRW